MLFSKPWLGLKTFESECWKIPTCDAGVTSCNRPKYNLWQPYRAIDPWKTTRLSTILTGCFLHDICSVPKVSGGLLEINLLPASHPATACFSHWRLEWLLCHLFTGGESRNTRCFWEREENLPTLHHLNHHLRCPSLTNVGMGRFSFTLTWIVVGMWFQETLVQHMDPVMNWYK